MPFQALHLGFVKLQQGLREVDAVEWGEGVDLLGGVEALLPEAVEFVAEVDDELLDVLLLYLLQAVNLELKGSQNRPSISLDKAPIKLEVE